MNKRVAVAMSGGVDSSVAAKLMIQQEHTVAGITLKLFRTQDVESVDEKTCCSLEDVEDARSVAHALGIAHYVFNFTDRFKDYVIERFIESYLSGSTPNPCIDCNRYIKFEQLLQRTAALDFDILATGHYAIIQKDADGRYFLKKALDSTKDQSYVLYMLNQEQLSKLAFPLGELKKSQVREIAATMGFRNAQKKDSQDICFVRNGDYADFIQKHTGYLCEPGEIVSTQGELVGCHKGLIHYTIGQRRGLGLPSQEKLYVCQKVPDMNRLVVGSESQLYTKRLVAKDLFSVFPNSMGSCQMVKAKIRYNQQEQDARIEQISYTEAVLEFVSPQRAVTPGQAVVIYDGEYVLGGGTIV